MNINTERYFESISATNFKSKWSKWSMFHHRIMKLLIPKYRKLDVLDYIKWLDDHKIFHWIIEFPILLQSRLCTGRLNIKDSRVKGGKTWDDNKHLLSKLCRYETWKDVKITWWDRIRFRIVTGCKFV